MAGEGEQPTQTATSLGSHTVIVQIAGDGNAVNLGVPYLALIPPGNRFREIRHEIDLLNPYCRSIPLVGREADMDSLWEWLHSSKPVSVRTLKGRAGAGKTRLAIELVERLREEHPDQWGAGFVGGRELRRFAAQQNLSVWGWAKPTLVVVDYAASLVEPLRVWLAELAQNSARAGGPPLRLLLLEREATQGEGWLRLLCSGGFSEAGVPDLFDPPEPKLLDHLDSPAKRRAVLTQILDRAAALARRPTPLMPGPGQNPIVDRQLENPQWEDPLYLMMAALLSLHSNLVEVLQLPRTTLALRLVEHENKRLTEGVPPGVARLPVHLAALAALCGGLRHEQALEIAAEESAVLKLEYPGGTGALVTQVQTMLPTPDQGIAAVIPDILAEALVLQALKRGPAGQQEEIVLRMVRRAGSRVIPFLVRMVQDFAPSGETAPLVWLKRLIQAGKADDFGLLVAIEDAMPHNTLALRETAVEVTELLAGRLGILAVANSPDTPILGDQARLLNNLANRLCELGQWEKALVQAEEALRLRWQLAEALPDAFLPDLAMSLNNLANILCALGRQDEALVRVEEAVRLYRQMAEALPDIFLADLAMSLNNLANVLREVGRREEALVQAEEAVRLRRQLAEARPDDFLPDLAMSLNNLAAMLSVLERPEEALARAEETVRLYRSLAEAQPDAFLPDLAMSLNNLAAMLSALERPEEALARAEESVRLRRQLAEARPDAFLPDLATSLNNLANMLSALGQQAEALVRAEEAVRLRRQMAEALPDAFLPNLATSLNNLAAILSNLERSEEALARAEEAVQLYRELAGVRPDAFLPSLAKCCGARGFILLAVENYPEAAASFAQGILALTPLFQKIPPAFTPSIRNLCQHYLHVCEKGRIEPDMLLLTPVLEVFRKLNPNPPPE